MKKWLVCILSLILALSFHPTSIKAAAGDVTINATNFPDAAFRSYVSDNFDTNGNGVLSASEIAAVKKISVTGKGITTMAGLEYFTALTELYCASNQLTALDVGQNTALEQLYCYKNAKLTSLKNVSGHSKLKSLDLQDNTALTYVDCQRCALTYLNVAGCTALNSLYCNGNQLASLNLGSASALIYLYVYDNKLPSLDLSNCTELKNLNCMRNKLTAPSFTQNKKLEMLLCDSNQLTTLDVSDHASLSNLSVYDNRSLTDLKCYDCALTKLDVSGCTALKNLDCSGNLLTSLNVSTCTALEDLNCTDNQLSSLNVANNEALSTLYCARNKLTALNVRFNTELRELDCARNQLNELNLNKNPKLFVLCCFANPLVVLSIRYCPSLIEAYSKGTVTTTSEYKKYAYNAYLLYINPNTVVRTSGFRWVRIAGPDRYETMAKVSLMAYADHSCKTIIVATGQAFPDALSGAALAGVYSCPIILTKTASLPAAAKSEIQRLAASTCKVLILGGTGAVSEKVVNTIRDLGISGMTIQRVSDTNREKTAIAVYQNGKTAGGFKAGGTVIVATGYAFADVLSISPYAYASRTPILLARKDGSLGADTKNLIEQEKFTKVIIVGGTGTVSQATENYLKNDCKMAVVRLNGGNRYTTSAEIMKWELGMNSSAAFQPEIRMRSEGMGTATGSNFADALGSVSLLGRYGSPILLVSDSNSTNRTATQNNITNLVKPKTYAMMRGYVFGGTGVVSEQIKNWLDQAVE